MRLIENWKKAWRMTSVQAMALAVAVQGAWAALPREMVDSIPDAWMRGITIGLLAVGIVGRLVAQPALSGDDDA